MADQLWATDENWSAFLRNVEEGDFVEKKAPLSYVEIAIIVVVLGVAARTITPRFSEASAEERISTLIDGLEVMRAHLDLYQVQHGGCLPSTGSFESFKAAMTTKDGPYSPYIENIPTNPFNNFNTVRFDGKPAGLGEAGWRLDTKTGSFQADNSTACAAL